MPATPIALGLGLLVCTVGLLIAPGPYHRFVEAGQDSGRLHRFTTFIADLVLALLPFALALGIGLFVGAEGIFDDSAVGVAAGAMGAGLALALWYGLPQLRKRFVGERERMITRGQWNDCRTGSRLDIAPVPNSLVVKQLTLS
jgi:hypothetical protein